MVQVDINLIWEKFVYWISWLEIILIILIEFGQNLWEMQKHIAANSFIYEANLTNSLVKRGCYIGLKDLKKFPEKITTSKLKSSRK